MTNNKRYIVYISSKQQNIEYCTVCTYICIILICRYSMYACTSASCFAIWLTDCLVCVVFGHAYLCNTKITNVIEKQSSNYVFEVFRPFSGNSNYSNSPIEMFTMSFKVHFIQFSCLYSL